MAEKKRKQAKKASDHTSRPKPPDESLGGLFFEGMSDRALEGMIRQLFPGFPSEAETPLDHAQELIYEAFEADDEEEQVRLAREALAICPDCADAYVLLAENAPSAEEALKRYEEGVAAGERAIGKRRFRECMGHFWGIVETRPYMRARQGLAHTLWEVARREEAVEHACDMLRLNPNDNQGMRYALAAWLLELDRDAEVAELLKRYEKDGSAEWAYTRALLAFRQEGDSPHAAKLLAKARKANRHVPAYLLGDKPMPPRLPGYITPGRQDEAISYAAGYRAGWANTPGAITWLRKTLGIALPVSKRKTLSWSMLKKSLLRVPQAGGEVWQFDVLRLPSEFWTQEAGAEMWMLLVVEQADQTIVGLDCVDFFPKPSEAWRYMMEVITKPKVGEPRRPAEIQVRQKDLKSAWEPKLRQLGVRCALSRTLDAVDAAFERLDKIAGKRQEADSPLSASDADPAALAELPQRAEEVWETDVRRLPAWITTEGQPRRPWTTLVADATNDLVLSHQVQMDAPAPGWLWEGIVRAIRHPAIGTPHRPGLIRVGTVEQRQGLEPYLDQAGIACVVCERLEKIESLVDRMVEHMAPPERLCPMTRVPGVTPEQVGSLFEAAAEFYRRKPWRLVPGDRAIKVECEKFRSGTWYAVVMGQSGMTLGLALYEGRDDLEMLLGGGTVSGEEAARRTSCLSLLYSEAFEIPVQDLDAAERYGWPVAGPEAYPMVVRVNPGQAVRAPLAWELELLEGCLRALPGFLAAKPPSLAASVAVFSGDLPLRLDWAE